MHDPKTAEAYGLTRVSLKLASSPNSTLSDYTKLVIPAGKRVSSAMDGKVSLNPSMEPGFATRSNGSGTNLSGTDLH
jgi:hypothetical protein